MMTMIKDGTGNGHSAKVTSENRLTTDAVSQPEVAHIAENEQQTYVLGTDFISITTTGSFSGIIYIKNTSTKDCMYIHKLRICAGGTSGSYCQAKLIANPTTGTLISDANAGYASNAKIGSSNTASALAYVASADAKTVTDGSFITQVQFPIPGHFSEDYDGAIILAPGQAMAITAKPSVAADICISGTAFFKPEV